MAEQTIVRVKRKETRTARRARIAGNIENVAVPQEDLMKAARAVGATLIGNGYDHMLLAQKHRRAAQPSKFIKVPAVAGPDDAHEAEAPASVGTP